MARQLAFAAFAGDDGGDALFLEPCEQTAELAAEDSCVGQASKEVFDGVEHHPFCADLVDRIAQPDEKAFEIVCAALLGFTALDQPATVAINGITVTGVGQSFTTTNGTFTVTSYNPVAGSAGRTCCKR